MPGWGEILEDLPNWQRPDGSVDYDGLRQFQIDALHRHTGRPVIVYATGWLTDDGRAQAVTGIHLEDVQGFMEVCRGVPGPSLDLVLHSPGGSAEAASAIVRYLRSRYTDIRIFVPLAAMSAATMLALSANRISMGPYSQLGPIDPQLFTPSGLLPGRAILDQFERAKEECAADPSVLGAWVPILNQYGPALIQICENAEELGRRLVEEWLVSYMLAGDRARKRKAKKAATYFADHNAHKSHSLGIGINEARAVGLIVDDLSEDPDLEDRVLSVFHAVTFALNASAAVKIIENHLGRRFIKNFA